MDDDYDYDYDYDYDEDDYYYDDEEQEQLEAEREALRARRAPDGSPLRLVDYEPEEIDLLIDHPRLSVEPCR